MLLIGGGDWKYWSDLHEILLCLCDMARDMEQVPLKESFGLNKER